MDKTREQTILSCCEELGAQCAALIPMEEMPFDPHLRAACEANYCGSYGKNWACPPGVGAIDEVIARAKEYRCALVFQTVGKLEDSFDFEGMTAAAQRHSALAQEIRKKAGAWIEGPVLLLTAGGCDVCERCAKLEEQPCRFPDRMISSLEAYGVHVARLAKRCNMDYINGENTVTYFGALLFSGWRER